MSMQCWGLYSISGCLSAGLTQSSGAGVGWGRWKQKGGKDFHDGPRHTGLLSGHGQ